MSRISDNISLLQQQRDNIKKISDKQQFFGFGTLLRAPSSGNSNVKEALEHGKKSYRNAGTRMKSPGTRAQGTQRHSGTPAHLWFTICFLLLYSFCYRKKKIPIFNCLPTFGATVVGWSDF